MSRLWVFCQCATLLLLATGYGNLPGYQRAECMSWPQQRRPLCGAWQPCGWLSWRHLPQRPCTACQPLAEQPERVPGTSPLHNQHPGLTPALHTSLLRHMTGAFLRGMHGGRLYGSMAGLHSFLSSGVRCSTPVVKMFLWEAMSPPHCSQPRHPLNCCLSDLQ